MSAFHNKARRSGIERRSETKRAVCLTHRGEAYIKEPRLQCAYHPNAASARDFEVISLQLYNMPRGSFRGLTLPLRLTASFAGHYRTRNVLRNMNFEVSLSYFLVAHWRPRLDFASRLASSLAVRTLYGCGCLGRRPPKGVVGDRKAAAKDDAISKYQPACRLVLALIDALTGIN